jgi:hypothetical protein
MRYVNKLIGLSIVIALLFNSLFRLQFGHHRGQFPQPTQLFQCCVSQVCYINVRYFAELASLVCSHQAFNFATRRTDTCSTGLIEIPAAMSKSMGQVQMHCKRNILRSSKGQKKNGSLPNRDISSTDTYVR